MLRHLCELLYRASFLPAFRQWLDAADADVVSPRGWEVLDSPDLMRQVNEALADHRAAGRHGPVVVTFRNSVER